MLEPSLLRAEMKALQHYFHEKRDSVVKRLIEIGFRIKDIPQATFYIWLDLTALEFPLPAEANISDGLNFFNALHSEKLKPTSDNNRSSFLRHRQWRVVKSPWKLSSQKPVKPVPSCTHILFNRAPSNLSY